MSSRDARGVVSAYLEPFSGVDFLTPVNEALGRRFALGDEGAVHSMGQAWTVLSPDLVWDTSPIAGGSSEHVYRGFKGFLDYWDEWLALWETYSYEVHGYEDCGEWVVADVRVQAQGRDDLSLDMRVGQAFRVEDGMIVGVMAFASMDDARERLA